MYLPSNFTMPLPHNPTQPFNGTGSVIPPSNVIYPPMQYLLHLSVLTLLLCVSVFRSKHLSHRYQVVSWAYLIEITRAVGRLPTTFFNINNSSHQHHQSWCWARRDALLHGGPQRRTGFPHQHAWSWQSCYPEDIYDSCPAFAPAKSSPRGNYFKRDCYRGQYRIPKSHLSRWQTSSQTPCWHHIQR